MIYDRGKLKRDVKLSMKRTKPGPILVAFLYTAVVSAGTWLVNLVLGGPLTGSVRGIPDMVRYYIMQGYEVEYAAQAAVLELLALGAGALFGAIVGGALLSLFIGLWQSTMKVGHEGWCLSMVRNENPPMGKIFGVLPQFGPVLVTRILTGIFEGLWIALACVCYAAVPAMAALTAAGAGPPITTGPLAPPRARAWGAVPPPGHPDLPRTIPGTEYPTRRRGRSFAPPLP